MVGMALSPMLILQKLEQDLGGEVVGLSALLYRSKQVLENPQQDTTKEEEEKDTRDKQIDPEEEAQRKRASNQERKETGTSRL